MSKPTPVLSAAGDYEEAMERYAAHLGKNKIRRKVFNQIYGRAKKARSLKQIMEAAGIEDKSNASQQVQNALEYLHKHHLVERYENNGHVNDRSLYVYGKAEFVGANKEKIVRAADNPKLAKKMPTKRRPKTQSTTIVSKVTKQDLKRRTHLTVLYLTANPDPKNHLALDQEIRGVQEQIRGSIFRDNVTIEIRPAADLESLVNGLNDLHPQIVHFSGHGNVSGLATDSGGKVKELPFDLMAKALAATDSPPDVVILNSCGSSTARKALIPPAKAVVTMRSSVTDSAAMAFAKYFYGAIASGQSVKSAFNQGKNGVEYLSFDEKDTPELTHDPSVKPASLKLT